MNDELMEKLNKAINQTIANMNNNEKDDYIYNTLFDYYDAYADDQEVNMFIDAILGA